MTPARTFGPRLISGLAFGVMAVFFVIPLIFMIVVSFYQPDPMGFYKVDFVWENYAKFFSSFYYKVSWRSLYSAIFGAVLVVALAFPLVLAISDVSRKWQLFWIILLLSLMCFSEVIIGFAWLILMSESAGVPRFLEWVGLWADPRSLSPSFGAMMIGLVYLGFSIVSLILYPSVARRDRSIEEAAVTLGTPPAMVFFKVLLPTFRTSLISVTLTMFVYLLGVFVMPTMLGRPKDWTMTVIISDKALGDANLPLGAALAVVMLIVTVVVLLISALATRGRQT
ncbi:ABC transporter permease subunit [Octadecabacter sp. CECT 8868]|uniref:ABC transporter permease n=1 Tax=Octadecabacter algicola TaxID=2909342 RepID=UPI001F19165B|nr:ABC transporter permease subunit [Octadecabacter algicola]MCF2904988.1 ABC transporter permease subunit [Octadecabacter algicola]